MERLKVYLAGQWNEHDNNWKVSFRDMDGFEFHDPELDSNQTSPDTFFPDDLKGIKNADIMIANPGIAPSEATWMECGYFLALNTQNPGDLCQRLIIVWREERQPQWSIEFVRKAGVIVSSVEEAREKLLSLLPKQP